MTISYADNYIKILAHWRGSLWKAVWKELLLWCVLYSSIKLILEYGVPQSKQETAAGIVHLFCTYTDKIPLQFLLGFYVGQVLSRWWAQIEHVPFPEDIMVWVCALLPETDRETKLRRHTVARYLILSETLVLRSLSSRIRKRFPTIQCLVDSELMTKEEFEIYNSCPSVNTRWQLPLDWAVNGVMVPLSNRQDNPIGVGIMGHMINGVNTFRENLRKLFTYDWICVPLVYTQTVSVIVYGYFAMCCIGHQTVGANSSIFVPVLTILQFVFYVGWLKVAQDMMRPFGEDDDDLELNVLLDRNASVAMTLADYVTNHNPPIIEDPYFKNIQKRDRPNELGFSLPYTKLSLQNNRDRPPKLLGDTNVNTPSAKSEMVFKDQPSRGDEFSSSCVNPACTSDHGPGGDSSSPPVKPVFKQGPRKLKSKRETAYF